ncbi:hypothetical protein M5689_015143 [Euphorbia peplus]|nr:hypothetical protein M5689_015143 [Euphorbia peplus]
MLGLKIAVGKAKVIATVIKIGGGMLMTFYRSDVKIEIWSTDVNLLKPNTSQQKGHVSSNYILGFIPEFMASSEVMLIPASAHWTITIGKNGKKASM